MRPKKFREHAKISGARDAIGPHGSEENPWHCNLPGRVRYVMAMNGAPSGDVL